MSRQRRARAIATLLAGAVLAATGGVLVASSAVSAPDLPPISAARLLASVVRAAQADPPVSGHVATHVDLGLPQLPDEGPQAATGPAALLSAVSGDHTLRLWRSSAGFRVNELLPAGERSITVSRTDAWAWDSSLYTAYHLGPFPNSAGGAGGSGSMGPNEGPAGMLDPVEVARRALASITPSTAVSVGRAARVAGRDAYVLELEPRTPGTLVGRVEISVDAEHRIPLRGAVFARGAGSAALSAAFTSVSFDPVDPSVYRFSPPPEAKVVVPGRHAESGGSFGFQPEKAGSNASGDEGEYGPFGGPGGQARTFGADWATIVALRTPPIAKDLGKKAGFDIASFLPYSGPLLSIRLVQRGDHDWLVYGAVPQASLARVESRLP